MSIKGEEYFVGESVMQKTMNFRNELKYYIHLHDYMALRSRLGAVMQKDPYSDHKNQYHVRSLYFDDIYNTALEDKLDGYQKRKKFRIRFYNLDHRFIRLEKKAKVGEFIRKESLRISREECHRILERDIDFLRVSENKLLHQLYVEMKTRLLKPIVIVDYVREAYVHSMQNIRITFDMNLKTGLYTTDLFDKDLTALKTIHTPEVIMEIKFNHFLPDHIRSLIQIPAEKRSSISKYVICRRFSERSN